MPGGAEDDYEVEERGPVFEVDHVGLEAVGYGFDGAGFAAEAADLCEAGNAGLNEGADVVGGHDLGELDVVFNEMRARADDAHFATEDV